MSLAYGTVQRRATLDYVAGRFCSRPLAQPRAGCAGGAPARDPAAPVSSTGSPSTPPSTRASSSRNEARGAAPDSSTRSCDARRVRGARCSTRCRTRRPPALRRCTRSRSGWPSCGGASWGPSRPVRCSPTSTSRPSPRCGSTRSSRRATRSRPSCRCRRAPVAELPEALVLDGPFDIQGSELFARGAIMAQARASMLAGRALAPAARRPRARSVRRSGREVDPARRADRGPRRAGRGRAPPRPGGGAGRDAGADARRLRAGGGRRRRRRFDGAGQFDAVLVDPPCSGLGTLQSRPDLRWRTSPERIAALAVLQARIMRAGADATAPGGALVYSVCTISRAEGVGVVESLGPRTRPISRSRI